MNGFQKVGGAAALVEAGTFVVGFALYFTLLDASGYGSRAVEPVQNVAFLAEHQGLMYAWNLVIYILFSIFLVPLALALHERLKEGASGLSQVAAGFGLIWAGLVIASGMVANIALGLVVHLYRSDPAQAATVWLTLDAVETGLGGGNEIAGALWVILVSWAGHRAGGLPLGLNILGGVIGIAGLLTVVPAFEVFGAVFGLGFIVWFVWVGVVMLRPTPGSS